jgi:Flp pilus assembly protein TadG
MLWMLRQAKKLLKCEAGNIGIIAAFAIPALFGMTAISVDFAAGINQKTKLRAVADRAALSAARELSLANATDATIAGVSQRDAAQNLKVQNIGDPATAKVDAVVDTKNGTVIVTITESRAQFLTGSLFSSSAPINVASTAQVYGGINVCLLGLDKSSRATIQLKSNAKITAPNCGIYSNSDSSSGLNISNQASLTALLNCTAGGYVGPDSGYDPVPTTDCPVMQDPLANRPPPAFAGCDFNSVWLSKGNHTLSPGVYCGGIDVSGGANVTLESGIYNR